MPFRRCSTSAAAILFSLLLSTPAESKSNKPSILPESVCGTSYVYTASTIALDRYHIKKIGIPSTTDAMRVSSDYGHIAVIEDDGILITPPNTFDLHAVSIMFTPSGSGYTVLAGTPVFDTGTGATVTLPLGDDDSVEVQLPFAFNFFGHSYNSVFVNTDGNLTFGEPDSASTERSIQRVAAGPPRIAPLFNDLNPVTPGRISVESFPDRILFTWTDTGEWTAGNGTRGTNTFQTVLDAGGTIRFNYRRIDAIESVVAIGPGGMLNPSAINLLDLSAQISASLHTGVVGEVFANRQRVNLAAVSQYFYRSHQDAYDGLVVFSDFDLTLDGAFAFATHVRNNVAGILQTLENPYIDEGRSFGSAQRLQVMVNMGMLAQYPENPYFPVLRTNNTLSILGHEFGHRWLSFMDTQDRTLLGRDRAHWSFFHNTYGSLMEGNEILDLGNGNFRSVRATYRYSPLDQYIMGLRSRAEVPPWFAVANPRIDSFPPDFPTGCRSNLASCPPYVGADFTGSKRDVTIDELIQIAGPRNPSSIDAPKDFRLGFILLTRRGQNARPGSITKVDAIRAAFEPFFSDAVEGRATMKTDLLYPSRPAVAELRNTIVGNGSQRIETVAQNSTVRVGYASLDAASAVAVIRSRTASGIQSEAAIPAVQPATSFVVFVQKSVETSTGLALVNVSNIAALVTIELSNGSSSSITLLPGEQRSRFIHELFEFDTDFAGTAIIRSNVQIAIAAIRGTLNASSEFIIVPVPIHAGPPPASSEITVFPQIADGGGYATELVLMNPASTRISGILDVSFGVGTDRGENSRFSYDIPAGGLWRLRTTNARTQVAVGFASIIPDIGTTSPVSSAIIEFTSNGILRFHAGILAQRAVTRAATFGSRVGSERSVIAIANRSSQVANIQITAYNESGAVITARGIAVPGNGHQAAFLDEQVLLPNLPDGFQGTIVVESSGEVYLATLRSWLTASNTFSMTAMPLIDLSAPIPGTTYFPQLVDGGNFTTEVLLMNSGPSGFRLQFFATDGRALPLVLR